MGQVVINKYGKMSGWSSITIRNFGRNQDGATEIEYSDETKIENNYGRGNMPVGYGEGNYEPKASLSMYNEAMQEYLQSLPKGKRLQDIAPFDITVMYEFGDNVVTDVLRNCKFKNNGRSAKQGDTSMTTKFELHLSHIDWNV